MNYHITLYDCFFRTVLSVSVFVDLHCLWFILHVFIDLRNEFNFWNVPGIMNTSGLLQSK